MCFHLCRTLADVFLSLEYGSLDRGILACRIWSYRLFHICISWSHSWADLRRKMNSLSNLIWTKETLSQLPVKAEVVSLSLRNRTAERRGRQNAWVWQTWQTYYLCVWVDRDLKCFLVFYSKTCLLKEGEGRRKHFSRLSHKVCRLLSSTVLLRKLTSSEEPRGWINFKLWIW